MWYFNRNVNRTYSTTNSRFAWAIVNGVPGGWKQIRNNSTDGVTNLLTVLSQAKANNRNVDVFVNGNRIERAILR